jgi:hypothetical protein
MYTSTVQVQARYVNKRRAEVGTKSAKMIALQNLFSRNLYFLLSAEKWERFRSVLKGQFHEIWEFFNGYTLKEHLFEIHR